MQALKNEHTEIQKEIQKGINDFKRLFDSAQIQIKDRVAETIQNKNY
jgi:hypothetical protein